jgi:hypothetical protein
MPYSLVGQLGWLECDCILPCATRNSVKCAATAYANRNSKTGWLFGSNNFVPSNHCPYSDNTPALFGPFVSAHCCGDGLHRHPGRKVDHHVKGIVDRLVKEQKYAIRGDVFRPAFRSPVRIDDSLKCKTGTRSGMRPRPGRTSPGTCQEFMGCRPVGRERQDAGHTARSCFVWPRHLQRMTCLLAYG